MFSLQDVKDFEEGFRMSLYLQEELFLTNRFFIISLFYNEQNHMLIYSISLAANSVEWFWNKIVVSKIIMKPGKDNLLE